MPNSSDVVAPGSLVVDDQPTNGGGTNPTGPAPHSLELVSLTTNGNPPEAVYAIQVQSSPGKWLRLVDNGGRTDAVMMRMVDILFGLPYILLVVLIDIGLAPAVEKALSWLAADVAAAMADVFTLLLAIGGVALIRRKGRWALVTSPR